MLKRVFDITLSIIILFLFSWVLLCCWLLAIIDTQTNGIFIQERIGQYGKSFRIYKLRTIKVDLHTGKLVVSRIGKILRRYKLDELPQFFNVLKGEMTIVGPRPDIVGYYDLLQGENRKILELKPGLTSLASLKYIQEEEMLKEQVNHLVYNDTIIFPDKIKMNLEYYYIRSFWGDLGIVLKTIRSYFLK